MNRQPYPTDLSDAEYACLAPHLPCPLHPGRPRIHRLREILDAIFYMVRSGCAWRLLPARVPALADCLSLLPRLAPRRDMGAAEHRPARAAAHRCRAAIPSRAAGSSTASRSRPLVWAGCAATTAPRSSVAASATCWWRPRVWCCGRRSTMPALQDRAAVPLLLVGAPEQFPRLGHVWVDQGYTGSGQGVDRAGAGLDRGGRPAPAKAAWRVGPARHGAATRGPSNGAGCPPHRTGFRGVLPRRWVVERTFAWIGQSRRLARTTSASATLARRSFYAAMTRLMVRRLARR